MSGSSPSLQTLARDRGERAGGTAVPRPKSRWVLRFVLPIAIVLMAAGLLAYVARDALMPVMEVNAAPVVTKAADLQREAEQPPRREPAVIAQAPGWIEPDPYAVTVQPMISGVIEEVLVLEGDTVEEGQILARLIAEDAELLLRRARAEMLELRASVEWARANVSSAEARLAELEDEVGRKSKIVGVGGVSPGEVARLEHREQSQRAEVDAARAALRQHEAAVERQQVAVDEAELMLARTVIRAPLDGVVLSRSVVPGTRIAIVGDGPGEQHFPGVVRLYDPKRLQVRADVPLADAGRVGLGTRATITTEAAPDRTFHGRVTRIVHRADIQRNTVQVKVRIDDPSPVLKPDMLTRVRFFDDGDVHIAEGDDDGGRPHAGMDDAGTLRVYAPAKAVVNREGDRAAVWVIEPGRNARSHHAVRRDVTLGAPAGEMVRVRSGLRPGDRVIIDPPATMTSGMRVRLKRTLFTDHSESEDS